MGLSHVEKLKLRNHNAIVLCNGRNKDGTDFWIYLEVDKEAAEQMHKDYESQVTVNFTDYGKVIKSGMGKEPPEEIRKQIDEEYGDKK